MGSIYIIDDTTQSSVAKIVALDEFRDLSKTEKIKKLTKIPGIQQKDIAEYFNVVESYVSKLKQQADLPYRSVGRPNKVPDLVIEDMNSFIQKEKTEGRCPTYIEVIGHVRYIFNTEIALRLHRLIKV